MKAKLRNITVNDLRFRYTIHEKYISLNETDGYWELTLRVFRDGFKNTALVVVFHSKDLYIIGNSLTSYPENRVNLHRPVYIRKVIEHGIRLGWSWELSELKISDGVALLEELGYDMDGIKK